MEAKLTRFRSTSKGTFGRLAIDGIIFYTLEREWNNNYSNVSCIPSGEYVMVPHESPNFGKCLAVVNDDMGVVINQTPGYRWGILLHPANTVNELAGCIAPGMKFNDNQIFESRRAFNLIMAMMHNIDAILLKIEWGEIDD